MYERSSFLLNSFHSVRRARVGVTIGKQEDGGEFSNSETLFSHLFLFIVEIEKHCLVPKEQFGVFQMSSCKAACFRCSLLYLTKMEQKSRRMKKTAGQGPG
jgi:hypothetical protein